MIDITILSGGNKSWSHDTIIPNMNILAILTNFSKFTACIFPDDQGASVSRLFLRRALSTTCHRFWHLGKCAAKFLSSGYNDWSFQIRNQLKESWGCQHAELGIFGFSVLKCSSKCHFQANLAIKISYFWARPFEITYSHSNSLDRKC